MKDIVQRKLDEYNCMTAEDEENALREITQEIALFALGKSGFFKKAAFQGGTCLRILHGLDRFSEDLDFVLLDAKKDFDLQPYIEQAARVMDSFAYNIELSGKSSNTNVQKRFLKDDSIKKVLIFKHNVHVQRKIKIKVELDINPPAGSIAETAYCDFPLDYPIVTQDLPSLFAGKCHALLCRGYVKGRDWYDFAWYISQSCLVNYDLLSAALQQVGDWQGQGLHVDHLWLTTALRERIATLDWQMAVNDVQRFVSAEKQSTLELWGVDFFLSKLSRLAK